MFLFSLQQFSTWLIVLSLIAVAAAPSSEGASQHSNNTARLSAAAFNGSIAIFKACIGNESASSIANSTSTRSIQVAYRDSNITIFKTLQNLTTQLRGANRQPVAHVQPNSTNDVAAAVRCSNAAGLKFVARNGGHSYEAQSLLAGGVVIYLVQLDNITINNTTATVTIGAGQRLGPLYAALAERGYVFPGGTCVGVGVSGLTLGGGLGHATRSLGMTADSVLAATVVLANGSVVQTNETQNSDLLWGISGGGPLYGIVTSWTFRLHKAPDKVSVVRYRYEDGCTEAKYSDVLNAFNQWMPWELPKDHAFAEIQCGYDSLQAQFYVWGPMVTANKTMALSPVFNLSGLYPVVHREFTWSDFVVYVVNLQDEKGWSAKDLQLPRVLAAQAKERSVFAAASLLLLQPMSNIAIAALTKAVVQVQKHAFVQHRAWGGQVAAVDKSVNAFLWRGMLAEIQLYSNSGNETADMGWTNSMLATMQPLVGYAEYFNYYHCVKHPWITYFGPHADRLKAIKAAYDPMNRIGGLYCSSNIGHQETRFATGVLP